MHKDSYRAARAHHDPCYPYCCWRFLTLLLCRRSQSLTTPKLSMLWSLYYTGVQIMIRAGSSIKPQVSSATSAACNSNSNVIYFGIMLTAMNSGRGWHSQFFVKDLGLELAPKMCPDESQSFKEFKNSQAFTVGSKKMTLVFLGWAVFRCSKACLHKVLRKYSKSWLRMIGPILSQI